MGGMLRQPLLQNGLHWQEPQNSTGTDPQAWEVIRTQKFEKELRLIVWNPRIAGVQKNHHFPCIHPPLCNGEGCCPPLCGPDTEQ